MDIKEYIDNVKLILDNTTMSTNDKIQNILEKNNETIVNKTTSIINEVVPKNNDKVFSLIENNVKSIGSLGSDKDMIGGIDCEIEIDGKITTGQIKPFTQLIKEKDTITIIGSASVKPYKTDWLIFSKNDKEIILIKNENSKIVQGNFVFPKENLKYTII